MRFSLVILAFACASVACASGADRRPRSELRTGRTARRVAPERLGRCRDHDPQRRAFFGDLHVHTSYSLDANLKGTRLSPRDAYRFAQGERVALPGPGLAPRYTRIDRPLDFAAVTDHAEFLGVIALCEDPRSVAYQQAACRSYRNSPERALLVISSRTAGRGDEPSRPNVCGQNGADCVDATGDMWRDLQNVAEEHYDRSPDCAFTTFVGYEWTANPIIGLFGKVRNLHRNVLFRNHIVPALPADFFAAPRVTALWRSLHAECLDAGTGCDALAIPHNSNLSAGAMFSDETVDGEPIDAEYVRERARMEPLIEVYQHKGASECVPGSLATDEECGFELVPYDHLAGAARDLPTPQDPRGFLRHGFGEGMRLETRYGVNPFGYGVIASTDTHLALAGQVQEGLFAGGGGAGETPGGEGLADRIYFSGGGLAAVWAEENSREALFQALRRRETYGTSGPRIVLRVFAGYELGTGFCEAAEPAAMGYERGVPMGGTLPPATGGRVPHIAIAALRDPGTPQAPGAALERAQVVKGWLDADDGAYHVRVVDVAGEASGSGGATLGDCEAASDGAASLCTVWMDDDFDPRELAYYYARVLEVPSCRWTTCACLGAGYDCAGERAIDVACCDPRVGLERARCATLDCEEDGDDPCCQASVEPVLRERAWSSPIWYRGARSGATHR